MKKIENKHGDDAVQVASVTAQPGQNDGGQLMQTLLTKDVAQSQKKAEPVFGIVVGVVQSILDDGRAQLHVADLAVSDIVARIACAPDSIRPGVAAAAMFEQGDVERALIIGPMHAGAQTSVKDEKPQHELTVDKQRIVIEAEQELELRCGDAAIILTADGRILQRAAYISSHASATQRILGGSVQIN